MTWSYLHETKSLNLLLDDTHIDTFIHICVIHIYVYGRCASQRHQASRVSTARLGSLEGEKAKKTRRIMRRRGRRRRDAGGGGSGGRNGGRISSKRERKRRTATDLAVIKELPVKPIGLGVTSNLSCWLCTLIFH